jgi:hypothetical protein
MKLVARLFLILVVLMPWLVSTLPRDQLLWLASLFKFVPSSNYFYSIGTSHAMEECVDFGVVLVSALLFSGIMLGSASTRSALRNARARRTVTLRDRLVFVGIALLAAFPWFAPGYIMNDYSGASVGLVSRVVDTNVLARGLFFAVLLVMAVFSILGFMFVVMGVNKDER